jgi:hypothetical protein
VVVVVAGVQQPSCCHSSRRHWKDSMGGLVEQGWQSLGGRG